VKDVKVADLAQEMPKIFQHYKQQTLFNIKSKTIAKLEGKKQPAKKKI
jgi:hypothetical protein